MGADDKRLQKIFTALGPEQRRTLLEFAEYLQARHGLESPPPSEPERIPRPPEETVVGAIKRLSQSYPMIDKAKILHRTSALMAQHVMHGRDAVEVIDELETVFEEHYQSIVKSEDDRT
ncbi:MAG: Crp/Fnr family transcriptional regulator [Gammaproteobacteria bacterium]